MAAEYVRTAGGHVAERVRPEPGSTHEAELDQLAADPSTDWRKVDNKPAAVVVDDPSKHTVAEVLAYLDGAGAAEALRVLDAEGEGKNRQRIVSNRNDILARAAAREADNPEEEA